MSRKETVSTETAFRSSPLMAGLSAREIEMIRTSFSRREVDSGVYVFRQGEPALVYYLLLEGLVKGVQSGPEGSEILLHLLGPGDLIGALPTPGRSSYPGSAVALSRLVLLAIPAREFERLLQDYPKVAINLLKSTAGRLQEVHARLREASTLLVEQRIARTLLRLLPLCGEACAEGIAFDLPLSRRDLAGISGTTIYTVSRTLRAWERQGWLRSGRRRLTLLSPGALEQACGE